MRYVGWRKIRGLANNTASDLVDFGKNLLGYLDNQRKLSGVRTLSKRVDTPAGSVFAAFYGDIPIIDIVSYGVVTPVAIEAVIEGFVVRPSTDASQSTQTPDNFVVLDSLLGWEPFFYQAADRPTGVAFPSGVYGVDRAGRDLFKDGDANGNVSPYANGIQMAGNVDWRSADEARIVSWFGPQTRYFSDGAEVSKRVFYHGQQLFDCSVLSSGGFFGDTSVYSNISYGTRVGIIIGACLTNNMDLLVVVRFGVQNGGSSDRGEFLVRLGTKSVDPKNTRGAQAAIRKLADITGDSLYEGNPEILWSQTIDSSIDDELHPWFFNSSCTQARCIRYEVDGSGNVVTVKECILAQQDDGTWTYSEENHDSGTTTVTSDTTGTAAAFYWEKFGFTFCIPSSSTPPIANFGITVGDGYAVGGSCDNDLALSATYAGSKTCSADQLLCAVDFIGDTPVYAYGIPPTYTESGTTDYTPNWTPTGSASISGSYGSDVTATSSLDLSGGSVFETSFNHSGITGGIVTPWQTLAFESSETQSGSSTAAITETSPSTSFTWYWHPDIAHNYRTDPADPATGVPDGSCGFSSFGPTNFTADVTAAYNKAASSTTFQVLYLDLRYGWLCYQTRTIVDAVNLSLSFSDSGTGPGVSLATTAPTSGSTDQTITDDYYVTLKGAELAHTSVVQTSSTPGGDVDFDTGTYVIGSLLPWAVGANLGARDLRLSATVSGRTCPTLFANPSSLAGYGVSDSSSGDTSQPLQPVGAYSFPVSGITWAVCSDVVSEYGLGSLKTYGSWQTYKGTWCFSAAMPDSNAATANFIYMNSGNVDMKVRTNTDTDATITRMHPIWVLPKVAY